MKTAIISAALIAMAAASVPAEASGTRGGGYGSGSYSGNASSGLSEQDKLIRRGKSQVRKRITCKKCDYHKRLNDKTAAEVARLVRTGKFDLKEQDRTAVLYFLRDRYGV
ncbi:MAG: hypothetical protein SXU28_09320 [Pseudomonadota bacterium]|nr:hypothetical protein [Pseudomonadota bacterium]